MSGEGNLALVGKSKHSTASKSQLCFAKVTYPRSVFINLCQNLGNFGWVHVEMKSWKSCGGALSRLCPYVGCHCVWEGALQTHEKPVMWRREVDLGPGPQPTDQRRSPGQYFPNNASCPFPTPLSFLSHVLVCQIITLSEALLRAFNTEISRPSFKWCFYTCCSSQTLTATCLQQQRSRPGSSAESLPGNDGWKRAGLERYKSFWHKAASLSSNYYYTISINILTSQAKQGGNNSSGWN